MDLIVVVQKLDSKILQLGEAFQQKFVKLEQFIHIYLQFKINYTKCCNLPRKS